MSIIPQGSLPSLSSLERPSLRGFTAVVWTIPLSGTPGRWTQASFHQLLRQRLLEIGIAHEIWCPAYCILPDQLQFLWMGACEASNQCAAIKFLRAELLPALGSDRRWLFQWVSSGPTEFDPEPESIPLAAEALMQAPIQAALVDQSNRWPYSGCVIPRHSQLAAARPDYWSKFWRFYWNHRTRPTSATHRMFSLVSQFIHGSNG